MRWIQKSLTIVETSRKTLIWVGLWALLAVQSLTAAAPTVGTTTFDPYGGDVEGAANGTDVVNSTDFNSTGWDITARVSSPTNFNSTIRNLDGFGVSSTAAVQTGGVTGYLVEFISFSSNDGTEFDLDSFQMMMGPLALSPGDSGSSFTVVGLRDGSPVEHASLTGSLDATSIFDRDYTSIVSTFNGAFNNIDQFTITLNNPQGRAVFDNIKIGSANSALAPAFLGTRTASVEENTETSVYTASIGDSSGNPVNFMIVAGGDSAALQVDADSGELSFLQAPDFENPGDANADNIYEITLRVGNGLATTDAEVAVTVTDVDESANLTSFTPPNAGTYTAGQLLRFSADYSYPVVVSGTPRLNLVIGSDSESANYNPAASTASTLVFEYTVTSSNISADTISVISPIDLNGGSIKSSGNDSDAELSFNPPNLSISFSDTNIAQEINFPEISNVSGSAAPFTLSATASSGLPVSYTIVSGPASISGATLTLEGEGGVVTVRAEQGGNAFYSPAPAEIRSFVVAQEGQLVFFSAGDAENSFAAIIGPNGRDGTLLALLPLSGLGFATPFTLNSEGEFTIEATPLTSGTSTTSSLNPGVQFNEVSQTISGQLASSSLTLAFSSLGINLIGELDPPSGSTVALTGYYRGSTLLSSSGGVHAIVGTSGEVYAVSNSAAGVSGGFGTVIPSGSLSVASSDGFSVTAGISTTDFAFTGQSSFADGSTFSFSGLAESADRTDRLVNLSTRANIDQASTGPLITGFVVGGNTSKHVLLRAVGPTLAEYGITTAMPDPSIALFDSDGEIYARNDNWSGDFGAQQLMARLGAFGLPIGSADALIETQLAPGAYTVHVLNEGSAGIAIVEIYDAAEDSSENDQRLVNISSRGYVSSGEGQLVAGFVVTGNQSKKVLIRGVGPELANFGLTDVLEDPQIRVFDRNEEIIAANDDWEAPSSVSSTQSTASASEIAAATQTVGGFQLATDSLDAALIITLPPGPYTVSVSSSVKSGSDSGNALIEVYEVR